MEFLDLIRVIPLDLNKKQALCVFIPADATGRVQLLHLCIKCMTGICSSCPSSSAVLQLVDYAVVSYW